MAPQTQMMYDVTIMHRTQLMLEEWQYEALKAMAGSEGKSLSAVVRAILTGHLHKSRKQSRTDLGDIEGLFSDANAVGRDHDRFLRDEPGEGGRRRR